MAAVIRTETAPGLTIINHIENTSFLLHISSPFFLWFCHFRIFTITLHFVSKKKQMKCVANEESKTPFTPYCFQFKPGFLKLLCTSCAYYILCFTFVDIISPTKAAAASPSSFNNSHISAYKISSKKKYDQE